MSTNRASHTVVLCLQDTTERDFSGQAIAGLGPLSYEAQRGIYLHPSFAVTPAREPLGVRPAWRTWRARTQSAAHRVGFKGLAATLSPGSAERGNAVPWESISAPIGLPRRD